MVLEVALIDVTDTDGFAAAYRGAREILAGTPGCRSVRMTSGIESPSGSCCWSSGTPSRRT